MSNNNLQMRLIDCNSQPITSRKLIVTPSASPRVTSSFLSIHDPQQFTGSLSGSFTASIVSGLYSAQLANPTPETVFYFNATETGSSLVSGSVKAGVANGVLFNLLEFDLDPFATKKVTLTPTANYPFMFSGSVVMLCSTSSLTNGSGSTSFASLIPGVYQVDAIGKVTTTFYISVPSTNNTASLNAKDLLVVTPAKGTKVKLNDTDNSYVLTVSASDARYMGAGVALTNADTASYAEYAATFDFPSGIDNPLQLTTGYKLLSISKSIRNGGEDQEGELFLAGTSVQGGHFGEVTFNHLQHNEQTAFIRSRVDGVLHISASNIVIEGALTASSSNAVSASYANTIPQVIYKPLAYDVVNFFGDFPLVKLSGSTSDGNEYAGELFLAGTTGVADYAGKITFNVDDPQTEVGLIYSDYAGNLVISASTVNIPNLLTVHSSSYARTASYSLNVVSSSHAARSLAANSASWASSSVATVSASWASSSLSSSYAGNYVQKSGDTMSGKLFVNGDVSASFVTASNFVIGSGKHTYAAFYTISFKDSMVNTVSASGDLNIVARDRPSVGSATACLVIIGDNISTRNLSFESGWTWLVDPPTTIAPAHRGWLTLTAIGIADRDVIAAYKESV